jgi:hypothetical protein
MAAPVEAAFVPAGTSVRSRPWKQRTAPRWRQASSTSRYLLRRDERFGTSHTGSPRPAEAPAPQQRSASAAPRRAPFVACFQRLTCDPEVQAVKISLDRQMSSRHRRAPKQEANGQLRLFQRASNAAIVIAHFGRTLTSVFPSQDRRRRGPSRWRRPAPPFSDGLERQTRPAERLRPRQAEYLLAREPQQRQEGRAPWVPETRAPPLRARARMEGEELTGRRSSG